MLGRRRRYLSQRSYQLIHAIHAEAERLRQIDRGLGYGHVTPATHAKIASVRNTPLHIGPTIEAVRNEDGWAA